MNLYNFLKYYFDKIDKPIPSDWDTSYVSNSEEYIDYSDMILFGVDVFINNEEFDEFFGECYFDYIFDPKTYSIYSILERFS